MSDKPERGKLIVFEGIDGSGKTTLSLIFYNFLASHGHSMVWTKEPFVHKDSITGMYDGTLRESFLNDRKTHVDKVISPALNRGEHVICDRYYMSTMAYQAKCYDDLVEIEKENTDFCPKPDIVFFLDPKLSDALRRIEMRGGEKGPFDKHCNFENVDHLAKAKHYYEYMCDNCLAGIRKAWICSSSLPNNFAECIIEASPLGLYPACS